METFPAVLKDYGIGGVAVFSMWLLYKLYSRTSDVVDRNTKAYYELKETIHENTQATKQNTESAKITSDALNKQQDAFTELLRLGWRKR